MLRHVKLFASVCISAILCASLISAQAVAQSALRVDYPATNSTVSGPVVELAGSGADPSGTLEVEVLTNQWYLQTGTARINTDGTWTYAPCHLEGQGQFNNHSIRVTLVRQGRRGASVTVRGIRRR